MGLTNSQYQTIMREYEQKQLKSHDILTQHYEDVYKKLPEFKSLDESISIMSVQYGRRLLDGDEGALDSLKEEPVFLLITLNRYMNVLTARIPVILEM